MSPKTIAWLTLGAIAAAAAGAGFYTWRTENYRPPRPKPLTNLEIAEAWLRCIDCRGSFLRRISELRGKSRDSVMDFFTTALLTGPDSSRRVRREAALRRTWVRDSIYRTRIGVGILKQDSIVQLYSRGFEVTWRSRAAAGLAVIGGNTALAALDSALNLAVHNQRDNIILRALQQAKADSALKGLNVVPPAGTDSGAATGTVKASDSITRRVGTSDSVSGTGSVTGRVVNVEGTPLINAEVQVEAGRLSRDTVTGNNGEYTIDHVPAGTHKIRVRMLRYRTRVDTVTVVAGDRTDRDIILQIRH